MTAMGLDRRNSQDIAPVTMRRSGGGRPTERWQDKSLEVRGGRSVEEGASIKHYARCAPVRDSLSVPANLWRYTSRRTSRIGTS